VYVYAKPSGGKWQTLGSISNASFELNTHTVRDSKGRNKGFAASWTAKCEMNQCSLTELELMDDLNDGTNAFLFQAFDAAAIPTGGAAATVGWFTVTAAQVGCKAKPILSGDPDVNRKIELEWQGSFIFTSIDAIVKASIDDDEFESSADAGTFHAIGTYTAAKNGGLPTEANIRPAGIASVTIADTGGAAQTLGAIRNPEATLEYKSQEDNKRRFLPYCVDIAVSYEWMETDTPNLLNLDTMSDAAVDVVITFLDGLIMTLTDQVGIQTSFQSTGDAENIRVIKMEHTGSVQKSAVDGIFST
jgi:hypothetical protein